MHFAVVVLVVEEELGCVQEIALDVVDGRCREDPHHDRDPVVADASLPGAVAVVVRGDRDVLEHVGPDGVVLGPLDAVLLHPGDRDPGLTHFLVDHLLGADHPDRRVVLDPGRLLVAVAALPDLELHVG